MAPSFMNFYATFSASIRSVGTAVTLAAVGVYLHRRNFVSSEGKRTLARISQQVTFPLFLFTKICYCNQNWSDEPCPDVTRSLRDVWILLFWPAVVVGIGLTVGYGAAKVAGAPKSQFRSVLAACGFGNSTGLPITLLTVVHANFPATSDLGAVDPTLFLSVYLLLYPVLQWGVGGWLLAPEETQEELLEEDQHMVLEELESGSHRGEADHTLSHPPTPTEHLKEMVSHIGRKNVLNNKEKESFYKLSRKAIGETDASLYISDADLVSYAANHPEFPPTTPELPMLGLPMDPNENNCEGRETPDQTYQRHNSTPHVASVGAPSSPIQDDHKDHGTPNTSPCPSRSPIPPVGSFSPPSPDETTKLLSPMRDGSVAMNGSTQSNARSRDSQASSKSRAIQFEGETLCETCHKVMTRCFQPPVVGALAGIFVAATPLRGIFVDLVDRDSGAPLEWFFDGLYAVGQAAVPINMIILGCNLSASQQTRQQAKKEEDRAPSSNLFSQNTLVCIVIAKMLIMPLIGMMLALLLDRFILDIPAEIDGSFYLVIMIVFITPTANNVMVMVELSGSNTKEGIAQVIALQYACAPLILSLTMALVVGIASRWG